MEGATPRRGGELVRTCGRTSYSPPVPHQRPKKGGRSLHLRWPQTGTAGAPAGPEPQASQPHKEAPPRTSKRLFSAPTPHCLMCACGPARDRSRAARFPLDFPGLGGRGNGSSPGGDRGGPGACGPKQGRGGLCPLGPVRASAYPDGRLGSLHQWRTWAGNPNRRRPMLTVDNPSTHGSRYVPSNPCLRRKQPEEAV